MIIKQVRYVKLKKSASLLRKGTDQNRSAFWYALKRIWYESETNRLSLEPCALASDYCNTYPHPKSANISLELRYFFNDLSFIPNSSFLFIPWMADTLKKIYLTKIMEGWRKKGGFWTVYGCIARSEVFPNEILLFCLTTRINPAYPAGKRTSACPVWGMHSDCQLFWAVQ